MKDLFATTQCLSQEQIRDYLKGSLNEEARYEVENHLLDCELCSAAVEGFAESYNFDENRELEELAQRFSSQKAAEAQIRPLRRNYRWLNRVAAAAILLILPLAAWMYWNAQSEERLFARYFESYTSDYLATRSSNPSKDLHHSLLEKAVERYQQKEYLQSIPLLEVYLEKVPENTIAAFHAGMACLEVGQTSKAIQYLEVVRLNDAQYYEEASWYLALAHVQLGQEETARAILNDLLKIENGYYEKQVQELGERLMSR